MLILVFFLLLVPILSRARYSAASMPFRSVPSFTCSVPSFTIDGFDRTCRCFNCPNSSSHYPYRPFRRSLLVFFNTSEGLPRTNPLPCYCAYLFVSCPNFSLLVFSILLLRSGLASLARILAAAPKWKFRNASASRLLLAHPKISELLEIPTLVEACVSCELYHDALLFHDHVTVLLSTGGVGALPFIASLSADVEASMARSLAAVADKLSKALSLAQCIKIVGSLRRLRILSEPALRAAAVDAPCPGTAAMCVSCVCAAVMGLIQHQTIKRTTPGGGGHSGGVAVKRHARHSASTTPSGRVATPPAIEAFALPVATRPRVINRYMPLVLWPTPLNGIWATPMRVHYQNRGTHGRKQVPNVPPLQVLTRNPNPFQNQGVPQTRHFPQYHAQGWEHKPPFARRPHLTCTPRRRVP